jgi:seryl-tRNA synthetase
MKFIDNLLSLHTGNCKREIETLKKEIKDSRHLLSKEQHKCSTLENIKNKHDSLVTEVKGLRDFLEQANKDRVAVDHLYQQQRLTLTNTLETQMQKYKDHISNLERIIEKLGYRKMEMNDAVIGVEINRFPDPVSESSVYDDSITSQLINKTAEYKTTRKGKKV